jgi:phytoene dehydrogenase-like protein
MQSRSSYDAAIIGSGPNGLAAAITLARAGQRVVVFEARSTVGGGMRTAELTLPGFRHDACSAVHPLGIGSPFMRSLPLADFGVEWITPPAALAHPLDGGGAITLERSVAETAERLGRDGVAYRALMAPLARHAQAIANYILAPLSLPTQPLTLARFGVPALLPAAVLARTLFRTDAARGFFAGMAAHAMLPLEAPATAAFGLVLAMFGHAYGWPIPRGGSQAIADAMVAYLRSLGGEVITDAPIASLDDLPPVRAILADVTPRQLIALARRHLPDGYVRRLGRFRYGPGAYKIDYALAGPIPWANPDCARAATVHLGPTLADIARSERVIWHEQTTEQPYVLLVQPSLFDPTRAPAGQHIGWAYCHVPNGYTGDMTARIEAQIERFAPGFRDLVLARHVMTPADLEAYNPNYIGGDINGGAQDLTQLFTRPLPQVDPYTTPVRNLFLCSSSTPPGGGVHGMCGYHAARSALRHVLRQNVR